MAPSKRADSKRGITIYVDRKTYERFQRACEFFGLPMTTVLTSFMESKAEDYERKLRIPARRKAQSEPRTDSED